MRDTAFYDKKKRSLNRLPFHFRKHSTAKDQDRPQNLHEPHAFPQQDGRKHHCRQRLQITTDSHRLHRQAADGRKIQIFPLMFSAYTVSQKKQYGKQMKKIKKKNASPFGNAFLFTIELYQIL